MTSPSRPHATLCVTVSTLHTWRGAQCDKLAMVALKPRPHQQQCRCNIRLCCQNGNNVERVYRKIRPFNKVEANWTCLIYFDFVEKIVRLVAFDNVVLTLCWCGRGLSWQHLRRSTCSGEKSDKFWVWDTVPERLTLIFGDRGIREHHLRWFISSIYSAVLLHNTSDKQTNKQTNKHQVTAYVYVYRAMHVRSICVVRWKLTYHQL